MQSSSLASAVTHNGNRSDALLAAGAQSTGMSGGYSVAVLPTIASFFTSLSPRYNPKHSQPSPPAQTELNDARVPGEKSWSGRSSDVAGKIKLACNLVSSWIPQFQAASETVATLCSSLTLANDLGSVLEQKDVKQKGDKKHATACHPAGAAGVVTLIALDNLACTVKEC